MSKLFKNIGIVLDLKEAASPCRVFALSLIASPAPRRPHGSRGQGLQPQPRPERLQGLPSFLRALGGPRDVFSMTFNSQPHPWIPHEPTWAHQGLVPWGPRFASLSLMHIHNTHCTRPWGWECGATPRPFGEHQLCCRWRSFADSTSSHKVGEPQALLLQLWPFLFLFPRLPSRWQSLGLCVGSSQCGGGVGT